MVHLLLAASPVASQLTTQRDSSGVLITENRAPRVTEALRLTHAPTVEVGDPEGRHGTDLAVILSAVLLPGDGFAVVDLHGREIRIFDERTGALVRTVGRSGEGPGEFAAAPTISVANDGSLWAWDPGNWRLSRFEQSGELIEERRFPPSLLEGVPSQFALRTWHVSPEGSVLSLASRPTRPGLIERQARLLDPSNEAPVRVGPPWTLEQVRDGNYLLPDPFKSFLMGVTLGERIVISRPGGWQLGVYDRGGTLLQEVRSSIPRANVDRELIASVRSYLEESYPQTPQFARLLDRMELPDSASAISDLIPVADEESLWVLRWVPQGVQRERVYDIIDDRGRWIRTVRVPAAAGEVRDLREDRILTVYRDPLGVPYVRVYRLPEQAPH